MIFEHLPHAPISPEAYNLAIDILADCVNQGCWLELEADALCHDFLSAYESAFRFFGIEGPKVSRTDFWAAVKAKKVKVHDADCNCLQRNESQA